MNPAIHQATAIVAEETQNHKLDSATYQHVYGNLTEDGWAYVTGPKRNEPPESAEDVVDVLNSLKIGALKFDKIKKARIKYYWSIIANKTILSTPGCEKTGNKSGELKFAFKPQAEITYKLAVEVGNDSVSVGVSTTAATEEHGEIPIGPREVRTVPKERRRILYLQSSIAIYELDNKNRETLIGRGHLGHFSWAEFKKVERESVQGRGKGVWKKKGVGSSRF